MSHQITNPTPAVPAVFQFEGHEVRMIERNDDPWFNVIDICEALDFKNPASAVSTHVDEDDLLKAEGIDSMGRTQIFSYVNESGMYTLTLANRKPQSKRFRKLVTSEILPSIRKHGHYAASQNSNLPAIPKDPLELFLMTAEAIKQLSNRTIQIESQLTQMEDVALEAVAKSEQAVTTVDDFLATRPLTHTQCYEVRLAVEKKKQLLTDKYSIPSGGTVYAGLYSFLKHHFRVNTYTGIPSARYDEALMIINNITLDQLPENVRKAVPKAKAKKGGVK